MNYKKEKALKRNNPFKAFLAFCYYTQIKKPLAVTLKAYPLEVESGFEPLYKLLQSSA